MACESCVKKPCGMYDLCFCRKCKAETEGECLNLVKIGVCKNKELLGKKED